MRVRLNQASAATLAGVVGMDLRLLCAHDGARDDRSGLNFLFVLRQPGHNCSSFIEYLVHTLQLAGLDRVFHGFISNEGEFRLAVSKILKQDYVLRTFYGLVFYS